MIRIISFLIGLTILFVPSVCVYELFTNKTESSLFPQWVHVISYMYCVLVLVAVYFSSFATLIFVVNDVLDRDRDTPTPDEISRGLKKYGYCMLRILFRIPTIFIMYGLRGVSGRNGLEQED